MSGRMKPIKPRIPWLTPQSPVDVCAQAKCAYCGRYGALGQCEGCGAPNRPVTRIEVTAHGDSEPRYVEVWR